MVTVPVFMKKAITSRLRKLHGAESSSVLFASLLAGRSNASLTCEILNAISRKTISGISQNSPFKPYPPTRVALSHGPIQEPRKPPVMNVGVLTVGAILPMFWTPRNPAGCTIATPAPTVSMIRQRIGTGVEEGRVPSSRINPAISSPMLIRRGLRVLLSRSATGICIILHPMLMLVRIKTPIPRSRWKYLSATGRKPGRSPPIMSAMKCAEASAVI